MYGLGDIFKQVIGDLIKLEASRVLRKLLGLDTAGSNTGEARAHGGGGSFSLSNLFGSIFNPGGSNTGGFAGGRGASDLVNPTGGRSLGTIVNSFREHGFMGGIKSLFGLGGAAAGATGLAATAGGMGVAGAGAGAGMAGMAAGLLGGGGAAAGAGAAGGTGAFTGLLPLLTNPITGIVAGAAVGAFLLWRHFRNGTEKALRKSIQSEYGINVKETQLLSQIKEIGEQSFGKGQVKKHLLDTIRLEPVKELLSNYAESTGQQSKLTLDKQFADPTFSQNQFIRRINGGALPGLSRGYDHLPVLGDGGEFVLRSAVMRREGAGALDDLNEGRATVLRGRALERLREQLRQRAIASASATHTPASPPAPGARSDEFFAAAINRMIAAVERTNEVMDRFEAEDENAFFKRVAKNNPDATVDSFSNGIGSGHKKTEVQRKLGMQ
jgi:hypothetical protein